MAREVVTDIAQALAAEATAAPPKAQRTSADKLRVVEEEVRRLRLARIL